MQNQTCYSPDLITIDQSRKRMLSQVAAVTTTETIPLLDATNRVLARPLTADYDSPRFDTSMMDGYALCSADLGELPATLPVSQRIAAGDAPAPLTPGTAARIFTGAPLPEGADTVIMQEQCEIEDGRVTFSAQFKPGRNILKQGENLRRGESILPAGTRLQAHHLGIAASQGGAELVVYKRLRVMLVNSGDELVMPGQPLQGGQIYNSSLFTLSALLRQLGCEVHTLTLADDFESSRSALAGAAESADVVMTTGGVSVGDEDHIRNAVESLGRIDIWRIRIKPGKPFAFGRIGETPFIGLPGNPVSGLITFLLLARPYLSACMGAQPLLPLQIPVQADFDILKADNRDTFRAARIEAGRARLIPNQNSAALTGLLGGDGLIHLPADTVVHKGMMLDFLPFDGLWS